MPLRIVQGNTLDKKRTKKQCLVSGCTRHKAPRGSLCTKHEHESRKEKNPYRYWYGVLRRNAKRRGKEFTISLEYFIKFCIDTNYISTKGKKSGSMTIDRKIDNLGYIEGNIQIMEVGANSRKRFLDNYNAPHTWTEPAIDVSDMLPKKPAVDDEEAPF